MSAWCRSTNCFPDYEKSAGQPLYPKHHAPPAHRARVAGSRRRLPATAVYRSYNPRSRSSLPPCDRLDPPAPGLSTSQPASQFALPIDNLRRFLAGAFKKLPQLFAALTQIKVILVTIGDPRSSERRSKLFEQIVIADLALKTPRV